MMHGWALPRIPHMQLIESVILRCQQPFYRDVLKAFKKTPRNLVGSSSIEDSLLLIYKRQTSSNGTQLSQENLRQHIKTPIKEQPSSELFSSLLLQSLYLHLEPQPKFSLFIKHTVDSLTTLSTQKPKAIELYRVIAKTLLKREQVKIDSLAAKNCIKCLVQIENIDGDGGRFLNYYRSLMAQSIDDAYSFVSQLEDAPLWLINNMITRFPQSEQQLKLLIFVYLENLGGLETELRERELKDTKSTKGVSHLLINLMKGSIKFNPDLLSLLVLNYFKIVQFSLLENVCWVMYYISKNSSSVTRSPHYHSCILKAQTGLVRLVSEKWPDRKLADLLNLEGILGLCNSLYYVNPQKGLVLLSKVRGTDPRYIHTKLLYCTEPDELETLFGVIVEEKFGGDSAWCLLIEKLDHFNLLTHEKLDFLWQRYKKRVDYDTKVLCRFIKETQTAAQAAEMIKFLESRIKVLPTSLCNAYLSKVYKFAENDAEMISVCKDFFQTMGRKKLSNSYSDGIVLIGESVLDPAGGWNRYCSSTKDEAAVTSLLKACISYNGQQTTDTLFWDGASSSSVAVDQFIRWSMKSIFDSPSTGRFYPRGSWLLFIQVCGRFGHTRHLNGVIKWWENLRYTPDKRELTLFLHYLPSDQYQKFMGFIAVGEGCFVNEGETLSESDLEKRKKEMIEQNYESVNSSLWPWPSEKEMSRFRSANTRNLTSQIP